MMETFEHITVKLSPVMSQSKEIAVTPWANRMKRWGLLRTVVQPHLLLLCHHYQWPLTWRFCPQQLPTNRPKKRMMPPQTQTHLKSIWQLLHHIVSGECLILHFKDTLSVLMQRNNIEVPCMHSNRRVMAFCVFIGCSFKRVTSLLMNSVTALLGLLKSAVMT